MCPRVRHSRTIYFWQQISPPLRGTGWCYMAVLGHVGLDWGILEWCELAYVQWNIIIFTFPL